LTRFIATGVFKDAVFDDTVDCDALDTVVAEFEGRDADALEAAGFEKKDRRELCPFKGSPLP
jgi:hypothetical protein